MFTARLVLLVVGMLAGSVWIGSLVSLAIVSAVASRELDARSRVALFRGVGRSYRSVGTSSLIVATIVGALLAWPPSHVHGTLAGEFVLSAVLLLVSVAGMAQAKRMTVRRQWALEHPNDLSASAAVRRGALVAVALRVGIAGVTFAIVVLGAHLLDWQ